MPNVTSAKTQFNFNYQGQTLSGVPLGSMVAFDPVDGHLGVNEPNRPGKPGVKARHTIGIVALQGNLFGLRVFTEDVFVIPTRPLPVPFPAESVKTFVFTEAELNEVHITVERTTVAGEPGPPTPQELEDLKNTLEGIEAGIIPGEALPFVLPFDPTGVGQARDDVIT